MRARASSVRPSKGGHVIHLSDRLIVHCTVGYFHLHAHVQQDIEKFFVICT